MARRKKISHVETSALFTAISAEYGFDNEVVLSYFQDIDELQQLWETNNEVWIYSQGEKHQHGWLKESHLKGDGSLVPLYIGLHHTRVLDDPDEHDPLLVVSFEEREGFEHPVLLILTMIDHSDMFGEQGAAKHNSQQMHLIHKKLDYLVKGIFPTDEG
ncbi:Hemophilus-specific protein [Pantoea sp. AS-PWVM4]|uniref:hypothetical protein n=1 Tax=Pantoea sp. AS-PWVM4 TaxID=1332069 RepID=UPI0003AC6D99|nr:hypothetical protein [Pantoea sp. AS-PWVM4]ERK18639.1 Hemophilus-specific protein [Pantoea sp. AS-PWVM4]